MSMNYASYALHMAWNIMTYHRENQTCKPRYMWHRGQVMSEQSFKLKNKLPPFTQIPNDLITGPLSPLAKATYCYLASRPDDWDFWFSNIVSVMGVGVTSVKKALKDLNDSGWIERRQSRLGGRWGATEYLVNYTPWDDSRTTVAVPPSPLHGVQPAYKEEPQKKITNKDNSLAMGTKESFRGFKNKLLKTCPSFMFVLPSGQGYVKGHKGFQIKNDYIFDLQTQKFLDRDESFKVWAYLYSIRDDVFELAQTVKERGIA